MTVNGAKSCNAYKVIITLILEACRFPSNKTLTDSKAKRMETCGTEMSLCYSLTDYVKPREICRLNLGSGPLGPDAPRPLLTGPLCPREIYVGHFSLSDVSST
jgi:hypothetical protein